MNAAKVTCIASFVIASIMLVTSYSWAGAHPAQGYEPNQPRQDYGQLEGGTHPSWNYGGLTFLPAYPAPESLSDLEKYMIAGTKTSADGQPMMPWEFNVMTIVNLYYYVKGTIPDVLDAQAIADAFECDVNDSGIAPYMEVLKSPLTGEYPVLNAESFSRGNMYVHALTPDEMKWFASKDQMYYDHWYNGAVNLDGPVFYFRMYGNNGVIQNGIRYFFKAK